MATRLRKALIWTGDSKKRLKQFPEEVRREVGYALLQAEYGEIHLSAKRMQGINAVEIVSDNDGNTFRAVYTTMFDDAVYVLHCFQKKSKTGAKTPKRELDLIQQRLGAAKRHYEASRNA